jgi:hypothetical protein
VLVRGWILMMALTAAAAVSCGPRYPDCNTDDNCRRGEHCVIGQCQQCRHANDCGDGQRCMAGRCE